MTTIMSERDDMDNNVQINPTNIVTVRQNRKGMTRKHQIRKHLLEQSMNSKENKRYLTPLSKDFIIPEIAQRNTTKSHYNMYETSAIDFDALPGKNKSRMSKKKLRRAKKVKATHKHQGEIYRKTLKNKDGTGKGSDGADKNIIRAVREIIVPDMTEFEKYEVLVMSLLATYISGKEMRLGYWTKKIAFVIWALLLYVCSRVSHGSDRYWPLRGSSMRYENLYNFVISFIWLMATFLRFPISSFIVKTSVGVLTFCVSYILHVRGTLKGIIPELVQRRLKVT